MLELADVSMTMGRLDDDEKLSQALFVSGQNRRMWLVNEYGLCNLILQSRKPAAKAFKRWVTHEVLPQIRKTGGYIPLSAKLIPVSNEMSDQEILASVYARAVLQ